MVSPHFPPDSSAASHRVRLLAPHLPEFGWKPTVLTVAPGSFGGRIDSETLGLVPEDLEVVRISPWSLERTRWFRFGDLGLRAFVPFWREIRKLIGNGAFDAFFVTILPAYSALLGPLLKRRAPRPFVLDYQDPWVGEWGRTIGPGKNGRPDWKSKISRMAGERLEPIAVRSADAITAVSELTYRGVQERIPEARSKRCETIPIGGEPADFDYLRSHPRANPFFCATDGKFHLCYVGTVLPLGMDTLRSFLQAVSNLKTIAPRPMERLRIHFIGTSNQSLGALAERVIPEARKLGVAANVQEVPARVNYLDALNVLSQAHAVLLLGSSERHYTASKLYPALLAKRPLLAMFHADSTVVSILRRATKPPSARLVTYDEGQPASTRVEDVGRELKALIEGPGYDASRVDLNVVAEFSARAMARRLARVMDEVTSR
jgi:hypothetical protein